MGTHTVMPSQVKMRRHDSVLQKRDGKEARRGQVVSAISEETTIVNFSGTCERVALSSLERETRYGHQGVTVLREPSNDATFDALLRDASQAVAEAETPPLSRVPSLLSSLISEAEVAASDEKEGTQTVLPVAKSTQLAASVEHTDRARQVLMESRRARQDTADLLASLDETRKTVEATQAGVKETFEKWDRIKADFERVIAHSFNQVARSFGHMPAQDVDISDLK